ncbi:transcription elongation factor B polypeptide 2-like [Platysternon megacephalum]|uniref:Transcription elongation factor B polypeptide 2-like n=1 Tax=Platysternon megacephalum TaxID=55544 RepID=A0A4D9E1A7_9SAUR|nr:transcription elongation factor B polypeptide 2-like [Platysternon megacephalum]
MSYPSKYRCKHISLPFSINQRKAWLLSCHLTNNEIQISGSYYSSPVPLSPMACSADSGKGCFSAVVEAIGGGSEIEVGETKAGWEKGGGMGSKKLLCAMPCWEM